MPCSSPTRFSRWVMIVAKAKLPPVMQNTPSPDHAEFVSELDRCSSWKLYTQPLDNCFRSRSQAVKPSLLLLCCTKKHTQAYQTTEGERLDPTSFGHGSNRVRSRWRAGLRKSPIGRPGERHPPKYRAASVPGTLAHWHTGTISATLHICYTSHISCRHESNVPPRVVQMADPDLR